MKFLLQGTFWIMNISDLACETQTGSKLGKEYIKAVYSHSAYLNYMQRASCEMLG